MTEQNEPNAPTIFVNGWSNLEPGTKFHVTDLESGLGILKHSDPDGNKLHSAISVVFSSPGFEAGVWVWELGEIPYNAASDAVMVAIGESPKVFDNGVMMLSSYSLYSEWNPTMTMIERVARAICQSNGVNPDDIPYDEPSWMFCVENAKAAIAALMEPTPEMVEAGGDNSERYEWDYEGAYRAMIAAALKETPDAA